MRRRVIFSKYGYGNVCGFNMLVIVEKIAVDFVTGCTACTILHDQRAIPKASRNQIRSHS